MGVGGIEAVEDLRRSIRDRIQQAEQIGCSRPFAWGFREWMGIHGPVEALKRWLSFPKPSNDFMELSKKERLDLTMEGLVFEERYAPFFTLEERQKAWDWLARHRWGDLPERPTGQLLAGCSNHVSATTSSGDTDSKVVSVLRSVTEHIFQIPPGDGTGDRDPGRAWAISERFSAVVDGARAGVYVYLAGERVLHVGGASAENLGRRALRYLARDPEGPERAHYLTLRLEADRLILIPTNHSSAARLLELDMIQRLKPVLSERDNCDEELQSLTEYRLLSGSLPD